VFAYLQQKTIILPFVVKKNPDLNKRTFAAADTALTVRNDGKKRTFIHSQHFNGDANKFETPGIIYTLYMPYTYQKDAEGLFVCSICQATKKNQNTMHYHMKKHEGHLPYTCGTCKKEFLHSQTLALHISARHSKDGNQLLCPCCPYNTLTKANRLIHFIRMHCEEEVTQFSKNGLTCSTCHKKCNSHTAFLYHIAQGCITLSENKQEYLQQIL
jgi:hypothetical protein